MADGRLAPDSRRLPISAGTTAGDSPGLPRVRAVVPQDSNFHRAFVAIDGSKFKAVNNRDKKFHQGELRRRIRKKSTKVLTAIWSRWRALIRGTRHCAGEDTAAADKITAMKAEMARLKSEVRLRESPD